MSRASTLQQDEFRLKRVEFRVGALLAFVALLISIGLQLSSDQDERRRAEESEFRQVVRDGAGNRYRNALGEFRLQLINYRSTIRAHIDCSNHGATNVCAIAEQLGASSVEFFKAWQKFEMKSDEFLTHLQICQERSEGRLEAQIRPFILATMEAKSHIRSMSTQLDAVPNRETVPGMVLRLHILESTIAKLDSSLSTTEAAFPFGSGNARR